MTDVYRGRNEKTGCCAIRPRDGGDDPSRAYSMQLLQAYREISKVLSARLSTSPRRYVLGISLEPPPTAQLPRSSCSPPLRQTAPKPSTQDQHRPPPRQRSKVSAKTSASASRGCLLSASPPRLPDPRKCSSATSRPVGSRPRWPRREGCRRRRARFSPSTQRPSVETCNPTTAGLAHPSAACGRERATGGEGGR